MAKMKGVRGEKKNQRAKQRNELRRAAFAANEAMRESGKPWMHMARGDIRRLRFASWFKGVPATAGT